MPRTARKKSTTGIYHIIMRGINHQILFEDQEDRVRFIYTLKKYREVCGYELYAYCLMDNHIHLLIKEGKEPLETIMRRICGSYVIWYNKKYARIGYLFQDRFKSEPIQNDAYLLTVVRYIFQNPVKAGMVKAVKKHIWSNYMDYIDGNDGTDTEFVLKMFQLNREKALRKFVEFVDQDNEDKCLDIEENKQMTDADAIKIIKEYCKVNHTIDLQKFDVNERNSCLRYLKVEYGLSIRQIERLTGIGRGIIQRI